MAQPGRDSGEPRGRHPYSLIASAVRYPARLHESTMPETRRGSGTVTATTPSVVRRERLHDSWGPFVGDGTTGTPRKPCSMAKMARLRCWKALASISLSPAECYLIGRTRTEDEDGNIYDQGEVWEIVSVEVKVTGTNWSIDYGDGAVVNLSGDDIVIRIWQPNPAKRGGRLSVPFASDPVGDRVADSHIFAQLSSRLAGAGIPFPPPPRGERKAASHRQRGRCLHVDAWRCHDDLGPLSPSSLIIIVTAPTDAIDKARLMTFWTELDAQSKDMRAEAITRFAVGMDPPAEQILRECRPIAGRVAAGAMVFSHWGADRGSTIKMFVSRWPRWLSTPFRSYPHPGT